MILHTKYTGLCKNDFNVYVQDRPTINNSEIRLRYPGNRSGSHQPGGQATGPPTGKYQYQMSNGGIDCKMVRTDRLKTLRAGCRPPPPALPDPARPSLKVRMIYFVADVTDADGSFCVVPGS